MVLKYANEWENNMLSIEEKRQITKDVARMLVTQGDAQMTRLHYHIEGCDYHMSEQLCETNGAEVGANDLTWAYGTFLSAWYYRGLATEMVTPWPMENRFDAFKDKIEKNKATTCALCNNPC